MTSWHEMHDYAMQGDRDDDNGPDVKAMQDRIRELECEVEDLRHALQQTLPFIESDWTESRSEYVGNVYNLVLSALGAENKS